MTWPPKITPEQEANLLELSSDFALTNGLVYRPPAGSNGSPPSTTTSIHAPYSLFPAPFPRHLFEEAQSLQPLYNALYAHVTVDDGFLDEVVGGNVAKVDEFQRRLYEMYKKVQHEGIQQPLHLGLFRSDYLIHAPTEDVSIAPSIKQVEFNTISASFGCLSSKVTELHRYLLRTGSYPSVPELHLDALPANASLQGLAKGLAEGHKAYGNPDARILMVTQDHERNAFDQRPLEYELLNSRQIHLLRIPFSTLHKYSSLDPSTSALILHLPTHLSPIEISVVYYRSGYSPDDYTTQGREWETRLLFERSKAIKCPSLALQLAGCKKVQQVLAEPTQLARFLGIGSSSSSSSSSDPLSKIDPSSNEYKSLVRSFMGLYPLDASPAGEAALRLALTQPERFVLKPQREGGGNNIYRDDIPPFLRALEEKDVEGQVKGREGYILMELIQPPKEAKSVMVRAGEEKGVQGEVVSELGVYGICLFEAAGEGKGARVRVNETVGQLLRTKGRESDEGGVAVGFSVIDSVLLI